jgi:hypothetical protein
MKPTWRSCTRWLARWQSTWRSAYGGCGSAHGTRVAGCYARDAKAWESSARRRVAWCFKEQRFPVVWPIKVRARTRVQWAVPCPALPASPGLARRHCSALRASSFRHTHRPPRGLHDRHVLLAGACAPGYLWLGVCRYALSVSAANEAGRPPFQPNLLATPHAPLPRMRFATGPSRVHLGEEGRMRRMQGSQRGRPGRGRGMRSPECCWPSHIRPPAQPAQRATCLQTSSYALSPQPRSADKPDRVCPVRAGLFPSLRCGQP